MYQGLSEAPSVLCIADNSFADTWAPPPHEKSCNKWQVRNFFFHIASTQFRSVVSRKWVRTECFWHETRVKRMHRKLGASRVWERKVAWRWSGECKSKKRGAYRQRRRVKSFNPDKLSMQLFSKYRNFTSCTVNITTTFWSVLLLKKNLLSKTYNGSALSFLFPL